MAKTQSQDATRASLSALLDDARQELTASLQGLTAEQMEIPLPEGWSVKDILAHVAMWNEVELADMRRASRGDKPALASFDSPLVDKWNEVQFAVRKAFPLGQVTRELMETRNALTEFLASLQDGQLISGYIPVACMHSARHDQRHAAQIRASRQKASI